MGDGSSITVKVHLMSIEHSNNKSRTGILMPAICDNTKAGRGAAAGSIPVARTAIRVSNCAAAAQLRGTLMPHLVVHFDGEWASHSGRLQHVAVTHESVNGNMSAVSH